MQIDCPSGQNGKDYHHLYASKILLELFVWVMDQLAYVVIVMGSFRRCKGIYNCIYTSKIDNGIKSLKIYFIRLA